MRTACTIFTMLAALFTITSSATAQWGTVSGRVILSGKVSAPKPLAITKDKAFCGKFKLVDESLLVGAKGGLKNVVVYLSGAAPAKLHPMYAAKAKLPVTLDNAKCRYEPHIVLLQCNQELVVGNPDAIGHSVKIDPFLNPSISVIIPAGAKKKEKFPVAESLPSPATCAIHPWMNAYIVMKDHPYMAVTDAAGNFKIENLPAGPAQLQFWHEKVGYLKSVTIGGKAEAWKKGRSTFKIPDGGTLDLGDIDAASTFVQ